MPPKPKIKYNPDTLITGIKDGSIDADNLPVELYDQIRERLTKSLYDGFGFDPDSVPDDKAALLDDLAFNVQHFSAAKVHSLVSDIQALTDDEDYEGKAAATYDTYTEAWQEAEEYTTQAQGVSADQWTRIQDEQESLPYLSFDTMNNPCPECAPYDKLTAPVDDPIWDWLFAPLHFNCACVIRQEDESATPSSDEELSAASASKNDNVPKEFQNNPGKTGVVWPEKHAYFERGDKELAKNNFNLPINE